MSGCKLFVSVSGRPASEVQELNMLFDKYVPAGLDLILEGLVDGRQEAKIKTIVPLTNLNMVQLTNTQTGYCLFRC